MKFLMIAEFELSEILKNYQIILPVIILPVMVVIVIPLVGVQFAGISGFIEVYIGSAFLPIFLMIPISLAATICADSIAGEKERGTIEYLLSTPVSMMDIIAGKALSGFLISYLVTLISFIVYAGIGAKLGYAIDEIRWGTALFILSPPLAFFGIISMVFISFYARGVKESQQLGIFIIIPMILLLVFAIAQKIILDEVNMLFLGLIFYGLNIILLITGKRVLNSERLLTV